MTERDVQNNLVRGRWPYMQFLSVPNTNGFLRYEADLLIVSAAGYLTEVEIKVTRADLRADVKKGHGHRSKLVKSLWFAGPESLTAAFLEFAPERAGVLVIREGERWASTVVRQPKRNAHASALTMKHQYNLARLGALRYWTHRMTTREGA